MLPVEIVYAQKQTAIQQRKKTSAVQEITGLKPTTSITNGASIGQAIEKMTGKPGILLDLQLCN